MNKAQRTLLIILVFAVALQGVPEVEARSDESLAALGERLFNERALSADHTVSCATCHLAERAFADGRTIAVGIAGQLGTRNTPSLIGVIDNAPLFWDGRQSELQTLISDPLLNAREHGLGDLDELEDRLGALGYFPLLVAEVPEQRRMGAPHRALSKQPSLSQSSSASVASSDQHALQLMPTVPSFTPLHADHEKLPDRARPRTALAINAIGEFLRSLTFDPSTIERLTRNSKDAGPGASENDEHRGAALFRGRAGCSACHLLNDEDRRLTDSQFHDHGIARSVLAHELPEAIAQWQSERARNPEVNVTASPALAALGRYLVTGVPADIGKFRTPSLYNVAVTAPYMHDGSIKTLDEAVAHEIYYSAEDHGAGLDAEDRRALLAFLRSLTDPRYAHLVRQHATRRQ